MDSRPVTEFISITGLYWKKTVIDNVDTFQMMKTADDSPACPAFFDNTLFRDRFGRVDYNVQPPEHDGYVTVSMTYAYSPHITEGDMDRMRKHIEADIVGEVYREEEICVTDTTVSNTDDFSSSEDYEAEDEMDEYDNDDVDYDSS